MVDFILIDEHDMSDMIYYHPAHDSSYFISHLGGNHGDF